MSEVIHVNFDKDNDGSNDYHIGLYDDKGLKLDPNCSQVVALTYFEARMILVAIELSNRRYWTVSDEQSVINKLVKLHPELEADFKHLVREIKRL